MYIRYQISVRVNYVLIPGLDACTNYRFRVRVVTATNNKSRWLMKLAQTNVSEPGIPNIGQITKHQEVAGATGFTVTWDPPSSPPCEPTHYQIQYYIYQGDMCEDIPSQPQLGLTSAGSVNGSTFTFNILELRPNSEYMVFVRAKTSSGYGNSDSRKAVTGHSYPSGPPTNVHSTGTRKRSITFTWDKPDCGYRNGPITSYDVILSNSTGGLVHQSNVSDSTRPQTTIDGLIPYSNYSIRIRAWNYELPGASYSPEFWARTEEAKPGPPIRVNLPASDQESITVEWMSPNPPLGRIIGYYVLYWETDDSSVTPIVRNVSFTCGDGQCSDINERFSVIIPDLRPDTNYSVQASLILDFTFISQFVVEAETILGVGNPSPDQPLIRLTSEGTPSAIESVSYTSSTHSLRFEWDEPSCENLHDDLKEYQYDLYDTDRNMYIRYQISVRVNYVLIPGLDACTNYRFRVRVVTATNNKSRWLMKLAQTNVSEPGIPNIGQITKHQEVAGATGFTVTWDPPSSPPCEPTHYQIQYYIYQGDMCEDIPSQPQLGLTSAGSVNGPTFTFNILELRPNSEYMVFVRAKTSSGYGNSDSRKAVTGHSYPSGPPTNVHSTGTRKRSITFTWDKPDCGYRNGPITSYDVILSNSTGGVVHQSNVSESTTPETEIDGLIPYSNYSIMVRAWNYELPGVYSPEFWAQTDEAKPGPPIRVNLPASDQESITVEWMSPNPPLGRIIGYYVLYWETDDSSVTPIVRNVSFTCGDGQCSDINERFSVIIPDLLPDRNYYIQASLIANCSFYLIIHDLALT
ncbi:receptor-type tyrosine-protein phosphatase F-like [Lytechinus pictus]|uniref:receptor-type tyrosine-protein phosphatase F-like n=1 Tax=Lytechinus pictus TaxID=7653 RepID=UPI0030B9AE41